MTYSEQKQAAKDRIKEALKASGPMTMQQILAVVSDLQSGPVIDAVHMLSFNKEIKRSIRSGCTRQPEFSI